MTDGRPPVPAVAAPPVSNCAVTKLVPPLLTAASFCHALRSSCAERDSNFKLRRQNEAVRSDGRDSRGLPETCERRDGRKRDPTWRKRDPTWRKSNKVGEKANFVGEKKITPLQGWAVAAAARQCQCGLAGAGLHHPLLVGSGGSMRVGSSVAFKFISASAAAAAPFTRHRRTRPSRGLPAAACHGRGAAALRRRAEVDSLLDAAVYGSCLALQPLARHGVPAPARV